MTIHIPKDPAQRRYHDIGELIHIDTWGPYGNKGVGQAKFVLVATDNATQFTWAVSFLKKHTIPKLLQDLLTKICKSEKATIRRIWVDNEFPSYAAINDWATKHGISIEATTAYAHNQVGVAERNFRTIRERSAAMIQDVNMTMQLQSIIKNRTNELLHNTNLPEKLWPEAFHHAIWLKNRSPARAFKNKKTP